jgi:hypothetical protein
MEPDILTPLIFFSFAYIDSQCKTPAYNMMKEIGTKLSLVERNVPAIPTPLATNSTSKPDNQAALLGFLAGGDSQVSTTHLCSSIC